VQLALLLALDKFLFPLIGKSSLKKNAKGILITNASSIALIIANLAFPMPIKKESKVYINA
jgi:hypothetical protein